MVSAPARCLLTERQTEVLRLASLGYGNEVIGAYLNLSEQTVKNHFTNILVKLGADNRAHAVAIAMSRGWIPLLEE